MSETTHLTIVVNEKPFKLGFFIVAIESKNGVLEFAALIKNLKVDKIYRNKTVTNVRLGELTIFYNENDIKNIDYDMNCYIYENGKENFEDVTDQYELIFECYRFILPN